MFVNSDVSAEHDLISLFFCLRAKRAEKEHTNKRRSWGEEKLFLSHPWIFMKT